jgi:putative phosphotransacetylase
MKPTEIIIEVSARHIHISKKDFFKLFKKEKLTPLKPLSQAKEFAAREEVTLKTMKYTLYNVRILGPFRDHTQVEVSLTDAYLLGITSMIRHSGDLNGTPGLTLIGPAGKVRLKQGVIVPQRHIHCDPQTAKKLGLKNGQKISVKAGDSRSLTFHNVVVRIREDFKWHLHIDTDEANAAGIKHGDKGEIVI